jgi:hypothetical protein
MGEVPPGVLSNRGDHHWTTFFLRRRREGTAKRVPRGWTGEESGCTCKGITCGKREHMNLRDIKYHSCPIDEEDGILLVDMETESVPEMDEDGNYLYYCNEGHTFTVDDEESNYYSSWKR